jgi:hypothetical protein
MGNIDGNTESTLKEEASEGERRCQQEQHKSPSSHPLLQKKKAGSYLNYELFLSTGKREAHQESEPVEEKKRGE